MTGARMNPVRRIPFLVLFGPALCAQLACGALSGVDDNIVDLQFGDETFADASFVSDEGDAGWHRHE